MSGVLRWEKVISQVSLDSVNPKVFVDLAALDNNNAFFTSGHDYFQQGYQYRVRVLSEVATDE